MVAALFESVRDEVGEEFYKRLKVTDDEKMAVISQMMPQVRDQGMKYLYGAQIPAPSAAWGFEENLVRVARWQVNYAEYTSWSFSMASPSPRTRGSSGVSSSRRRLGVTGLATG